MCVKGGARPKVAAVRKSTAVRLAAETEQLRRRLSACRRLRFEGAHKLRPVCGRRTGFCLLAERRQKASPAAVFHRALLPLPKAAVSAGTALRVRGLPRGHDEELRHGDVARMHAPGSGVRDSCRAALHDARAEKAVRVRESRGSLHWFTILSKY